MEKNIIQDVRSSRCTGLSNRTAIRHENNKMVHARDVYKDSGPFYCPECLSEAIHKNCSEKKNHFAHKARQSDIIKAKDQELHNTCRDEILEIFAKKFPEGLWEKEKMIKENHNNKGNKEIIPDIRGIIDKKGICVEIQASAYTINKIYNKTLEYKKLGIYVLWIVPLSKELGNKTFRPRLFEKYLHSMYYGRVYYYVPGDRLITPVHYSPTKRWIEAAELRDEGGELKSVGGYDLTYKTIKVPKYSKELKLDLTKDFDVMKNEGFVPKNEKKEIPECLLFKDKLETWWDKDEYNNIKEQKEIIKQRDIYSQYDFKNDDYDDFV